MAPSSFDLKARVISATVAIVLLLIVSYFFGQKGILFISLGIIFIGTLEYSRIGFSQDEWLHPMIKWAFIFFSFFSSSAVSFLSPANALAIFAIVIVSFLSLILWTSGHQDLPLNRLRHLSTSSTLGLVYSGLLPAFTIKILLLPQGLNWFFLLLAVVFMGDTLAYFTGRFFGNKKLCSNISPKKTIAGAIGGMIASVLSGSLLGANLFGTRFLTILFFGSLMTGLIAQSGDIFESLLKRVNGKKDSGIIMPGHGGVLDRLDGVYFSSPVFFLIAQYCSTHLT